MTISIRHVTLKRRSKLLAVFIFAGIIGHSANSSRHPQAAPPQKPNIIYVLADQWRAQATAYNGDPNLVGKTPNLDKLAYQGVNFKNAVSVTPVCTPYRASLMTGQYPTTTGMIFNDLHLPEASVTMAELFGQAGYKTGYIGKWHLDGMGRHSYTPPERRQGFNYWKALECSHEYTDLLYYEGSDKEPKHWKGYGPYAETEDAIAYIRSNATSSAPFLLVLAWGAPHFPYHNTPDAIQEESQAEDIILRGNVTKDHEEEAKKQSAGYYAHIRALDQCMGQLMQAIDEAGLSENTIFVFTSDHGEMMGSQGVSPRQKQVPWAESVKVPFLLRYPAKFENNIEVDAPINTPDILPTLLSLADLPVPEHIEGEDMSAAIGKEEFYRDKAALIINVSPFSRKNDDEYRGVYTSRYAYVKKLDGPWLLFDHQKDPLQMHNLANKPEYEHLQQEMETKLRRKLREIGDEFRPRQYYIDKWGYELTDGGYIDYSEGAKAQGPDLRK